MAQDIRTRLILDNSNFQRGIQQSEQQTKRLGTSFTSLLRTVRNITVAVGGLAASITVLSRRTADYAARIRDLSTNIGVSTKFIQEFRFAAQQSGVEISTADRALETFSRRLGEAATGTGTTARTFAQLGIRLRDTNGRLRSAEDVMADVADRLSNVQDSTQRARIAFEVFGRSGIDLISVLNNGSDGLSRMSREAQRLGLVMSEQDVRQLGKLSDSYTTLGAAIRAITDQFVIGLSEALLITNKQMTELIANNQQLAREFGVGVGEALLTMANAAKVVAANIELIRNAALAFIGVKLFGNLQGIIGKMSSATAGAKGLSGVISGLTTASRTLLVAFGGKLVALGKIGAAILIVNQAFKTFNDRTIDLNGTTSTFSEILSAIVFKMSQLVREVQDFILSFKTQFEQALETIQEAFSAALVIVTKFVNTAIAAFMVLPRTAQFAFQQARRVINREGAGTISDYKDLLGELFQTDFVGAATNQIKGFLKSIVEEYRAAQKETEKPLLPGFEVIGDPGEEIKNALEPLTRWDQFAEGWRNAFNEWKEQVMDATQEGARMFRAFADGLTDSLTQFFTTGRANFRKFLQDILQMIIRSQIQRALAGILGGLGGGAGTLGQLFGGSFADGGRPPVGRASLVGERGPELFVPNTAGTIVPNELLGSAGTQPIVNNYITNNISALDSKSVAQVFAENRQALLGSVQVAQRELPF